MVILASAQGPAQAVWVKDGQIYALGIPVGVMEPNYSYTWKEATVSIYGENEKVISIETFHSSPIPFWLNLSYLGIYLEVKGNIMNYSISQPMIQEISSGNNTEFYIPQYLVVNRSVFRVSIENSTIFVLVLETMNPVSNPTSSSSSNSKGFSTNVKDEYLLLTSNATLLLYLLAKGVWRRYTQK